RCPSRSEARKHPDRARRHGQAGRLRHRFAAGSAAADVSTLDLGLRYARLHGARAGAGRPRGCAHRRVRSRRHAVRDADRGRAVSRRQSAGGHEPAGDHRRTAAEQQAVGPAASARSCRVASAAARAGRALRVDVRPPARPHPSRTVENGAWFDGSSIEGMARTAESDLYLLPEPDSFALLPWETTPTARLICDVRLPGGEPFQADPRQALKSVLAEALELGFAYRVSSEVEFFVFEDRAASNKTPDSLAPVDRTGYFEMQESRAAGLCRDAIDALGSFGVEVEATHAEVGPGQHEIDIAEQGALEAA